MTAALLPAIADLIDVTPPFTHTAGDGWGYDFDTYAMPNDALVRLVEPDPVADPAVAITNGDQP